MATRYRLPEALGGGECVPVGTSGDGNCLVVELVEAPSIQIDIDAKFLTAMDQERLDDASKARRIEGRPA